MPKVSTRPYRDRPTNHLIPAPPVLGIRRPPVVIYSAVKQIHTVVIVPIYILNWVT